MSAVANGMPLWADALVAALLVAAAFFACVGSLGLVKLSDFFRRLHGPTKAATLGIGGLVVASMVWFSVREGGLSAHEILIGAFVFFTAPVSAHMLAKAASHLARRDGAMPEPADRAPPDR